MKKTFLALIGLMLALSLCVFALASCGSGSKTSYSLQSDCGSLSQYQPKSNTF